MALQRVRVVTDLLYESKKPLTAPHLTMIANRVGTYLRTGAVEGLDQISVDFHEEYRNQHAHHHDARFERCRPDTGHSGDGLGPID
jgi:hypothetical protein